MRNFTCVLTLAAAAVAMPAMGARNVTAPVEPLSLENVKHLPAGKHITASDRGTIRNLIRQGQANIRKSPIHRAVPAAPANADIVADAPAGTHTDLTRSSDGYGVLWGYLLYIEDEGLMVDMVETADGKVWLSNPLSGFPVQAYFPATVTSTGFDIVGPQCVYSEPDYDLETGEPTGEMLNCYVVPMEYDAEEDWYFATDKPYSLTKTGDQWVNNSEDLILGLCIWDAAAGEYGWTGYADYNMTYAVQTSQPVAAPDTTTEDWAVIHSDGSGYFSKVAVTGSSIFVQGLYSGAPEAWSALELQGDKAVLHPHFLGRGDNWHWNYASGATIEEVWNEEWEDYDISVTPGLDLVFSYDAAAKKLSTDGTVAITACENPTSYLDYFTGVTVEKQNRTPGTAPQAPSVTYISEWDTDYACRNVDFTFPPFDLDGNLLDTAHLSFRVYIDGEPFTFYEDEYINLDAPKEQIPWGFNDAYDFYSVGVYHTFYLYMDGIETVGLQAIYLDPATNGIVESQVTTVDVAKVNAVEGGRTVKATEYFDLQGRRVASPANGFYIQRTTFSDGSVSNSKICK